MFRSFFQDSTADRNQDVPIGESVLVRFFSFFFFLVPRRLSFWVFVPGRNRRAVVLPILQGTILGDVTIVVVLKFREGYVPQTERDRPGQGIHAEVFHRRESRRRSLQLVRAAGTIRPKIPSGARRYRCRFRRGRREFGADDPITGDAPPGDRTRNAPIHGHPTGRMVRMSVLPRSKDRYRALSILGRTRLSSASRGCGYRFATDRSTTASAATAGKPQLSEWCRSTQHSITRVDGRWNRTGFSKLTCLETQIFWVQQRVNLAVVMVQ